MRMEKVQKYQYSMTGHCKQVVDKYLELSAKDIASLRQVATPCIDDQLILADETVEKGGLSSSAARIVLKALFVV